MIGLIARIPLVKIWWRRKLKKEQAKLSAVFDEEFKKTLDTKKVTGLPVQGMSAENLRHRIG